jgi:hypothetical protein
MLRLVGQRAMRQVTQVGTIRQLAGAAAKEEVVDWDEMAKLVTTPAGKRELMNLRSTIQDLIQKATVPKTEPIDWEKFKKETGMPELVSAYEKAFKGMQFPKYPGTEIADCMAQLKALEQSIDKDIEASKPELARIEKELAKLEQMDEAIEDMKLDEFVAAYGNMTEWELENPEAQIKQLEKDIAMAKAAGMTQLVEQGEALLVHLNAPKEARELGPEAMQIPE